MVSLCAIVALVLECQLAVADSPPPSPEPVPLVLTIDDAIRFALQGNPSLAAQRQQRGIAAAQVIIADTYPFNPVTENRIQVSGGPASAGITNQVPIESLVLWEVEVHGQRNIRRQEATATVSRTEWQIAQQEQMLAVQVIRTFTTLLYRQEKLQLVERTLRINQELVKQVGELVRAGKLGSSDLILAQTEVDSTQDLVSAARDTLTTARYDLLRALGIIDAPLQLQGRLEEKSWAGNLDALLQVALERRADLHAREAAVAEADATLRLVVANRYGNPTIGPAFTYDPTRVSQGGVQINFPLPVLNTHRGEIRQSQAERARAELELRQTEVLVRQDVRAAVAALVVTQQRAEGYRTRILPALRKGVEDMEKLFRASAPGVDVLRVIDVRRKLLTAQDTYLDALWRVSQARADLVAAAGDPSAIGLAPFNYSGSFCRPSRARQ